MPIDPAVYAAFPEGVFALVGRDLGLNGDDRGFGIQAGIESVRIIPEPSTALLMGIGLALLGVRRS